MIVRRDWTLEIGVDNSLRGQGANPQALRSRSPKLVHLAERALEEERDILAPAALYDTREIVEVRHEQIRLDNGKRLIGPLIGQHLAASR